MVKLFAFIGVLILAVFILQITAITSQESPVKLDKTHAPRNSNGKSERSTGHRQKSNISPKSERNQPEIGAARKEAQAVLLDENLLYEVLRHVDDGQTLAKAACVSRQWRRTTHDERLWELICTKYDHRSPIQLRIVVLALGGFHRLYSSYLWPIFKSAAPSCSSAPPAVSVWPGLPPALAVDLEKKRVGWDRGSCSSLP
ncbi:hypothetical protein CASFOL_031309 [Castilleja foliolosa]|uniref:F-box domain-containing protein n=1 Tax=Castilleja foliolosa TaxID=1961234 RepID=A0ABD3C690_9LAMI